MFILITIVAPSAGQPNATQQVLRHDLPLPKLLSLLFLPNPPFPTDKGYQKSISNVPQLPDVY